MLLNTEYPVAGYVLTYTYRILEISSISYMRGVYIHRWDHLMEMMHIG